MDAMESPDVVETVGLTKRFGERTAVDRVDLRVPRGSAFGYLGPNGAGKTTLIRMLLGLTRPDAGSMRLLGRAVPEQRSEALARVGAIVEEPHFLPYLTGRENLEVVAAAREPAAHGRIPGALARVGLAARANDRVKTYSQGMRQRLGVARALLADPELLILDEPMNGLDPAGILEMRGMIRALVAEGRTVMLSSHLLDEVEKVCDAVAIVDRGRIVAQGPIAELRAGAAPTVELRTGGDQMGVLALLAAHPAVAEAVGTTGGTSEAIRVTLAPAGPAEAARIAADLNRQLVQAGVTVYGFGLARASLEERFLEITSRLGTEAVA
ncbi:MAG TPA: ABC transporter ATP-binding protein [Actinomycetes bacterium]|nr:ABC transporter ATP-binding protein [Actinomycetes bacterium]